MTGSPSSRRDCQWVTLPQLLSQASSGNGNVKCPLKVMISGAPAAGKGTQCAKIVEKVQALSTGLLAWTLGAMKGMNMHSGDVQANRHPHG